MLPFFPVTNPTYKNGIVLFLFLLDVMKKIMKKRILLFSLDMLTSNDSTAGKKT
jgi:hypothetical protein